MFIRATREAMQKGLNRLTRIDVLPSISVEEYEELLLHLMKCRSINISRVFSSVTRIVVLCRDKQTHRDREKRERKKRDMYSLTLSPKIKHTCRRL